MRKMAAELGVGRESLRRVVTRDLGLSSLKRKTVHSMTQASKKKRLDRSRALLERFTLYGLDKVLFSDEKLFTVEEIHNHQNDRILAKNSKACADDVKNVHRTQKPASVMVWAGI